MPSPYLQARTQGFKQAALFIAINLSFASLSGCSDSNNSTPSDGINSQYQGIWVAPAYGQALHIESDAAKIYQFTSDYCLIEDRFSNLKQADLDREFKLIKTANQETQLEQFSGNGTRDFHAPGERYTRMESLPPSCQKNLIASLGDENYQADAQRDFDIFSQSIHEYSISIEAQNLDWLALKQSAQTQFDASADEAEQLLAYQQIINGLADVHTSFSINDVSLGAPNKPMLYQLLISEYLSDNNLQAPYNDADIEQALGYMVNQVETIDSIVFDYAEQESDIKSAANDNFRWFNNQGLGYLKIATMGDVIANEDALEDHEINAAKLAAVDLAMDTALKDLADTQALIVDIRNNPGGEDFVALAILSRFIEQEQTLYSKQARLGNSRSELRAVTLSPRGEYRYSKPIILIVSASTVSGAEVFALGMSSLAHVTLIGQATQGALSDALDKELPSGHRFSLSNEYYLSQDGSWYEASGIPVDVEVDVFNRQARENEQDLAIETAIALLSE